VHIHLAPLRTLNKQQRKLTAQTAGGRDSGRGRLGGGGLGPKHTIDYL